MNAFEVKEEVLSWMEHVPENCILSTGERGVVTGMMNFALKLGGDMKIANDRRRIVLAWIFRDLLNKPMAGAISAKQLSDGMWFCLCSWTDAHKDQDTGIWTGKLGFEEDLVVCLRAMESWEHDINSQLGFEV